MSALDDLDVATDVATAGDPGWGESLVELEVGFGQLGAGTVNAPERNEIGMPDESFLLGMPGTGTAAS